MRGWQIVLSLSFVVSSCRETVPTTAPASSELTASLPEMRQGWIIGRYGRATEISFEVKDNLAVFEGDIVIGSAEEIARTREELEARRSSNELFGVVSGTTWIDGRVPYVIHQGFSSSQRNTIEAAIDMIEAGTWGVTFVPQSGQSDRVDIIPSSPGDCRSNIGRIGGLQHVWLGPDCVQVGTVAHELLHTLGLHHEHSRCDREAFIHINENNIKNPWKSHYSAIACASSDRHFEQYNESSVMHYRAFASSDIAYDPSVPVITSKRGFDLNQMGRRDSLATTDYGTVNAVYYPYGPSVGTTYPNGTPSVIWNANGGSYEVKYVQVREEYSVWTGQLNEYVVQEYVIASGVADGPIADPYQTYTGNSQCVVSEDENGRVAYVHYYQVTGSYPYHGSPPPGRAPADVAVCY